MGDEKQTGGGEVEIVDHPGRVLAVTRFHVDSSGLATMGDRMGGAFTTVADHLARVGATAEGPAVATYHPAGDGFDVAAGFPFGGPFEAGDGVDLLEVPAGEYAHITHVGPYDQVQVAYGALRSGAAALGRELSDGTGMWEEYWSPPDTPPEEIRTEVYWPVVAA